LFAVELDRDRGGNDLADVIYRHCIERGVIPMFSPPGTVAFSAPLVIDQRNLEECIDILGEVIAVASQ
jgi:4-aminobutyrate aminotransferase-like enzyme